MKKNLLILTAMVFALIAFHGNAQNMVSDGDFSSTVTIPQYSEGPGPSGGWFYFVNPGNDAIPVVESGVCHYQVNNGGFDFWEVQLMQWGFPLVQGNTYQLTFDVRSDDYRWFGVYLGEDGGGWTSILGYENYYNMATPDWQTYSFEFIADEVFPWHKLSFELGGYNVGLYIDNVLLEDLGKLPIRIGILGSAILGWDEDVDMVTSDEITYTLENYPLMTGEVKFRQNDSWELNWGDTSFPSGTGFLYGPNIPIYALGNYDITFNRVTGEYNFVCVDNCSDYVRLFGTAVPPWDTEPLMQTADGTNFRIAYQNLLDGYTQFRVNGDSDQMWGGDTFPDGIATPGGPLIPVPAGVYAVNFNLSTGEYHFVYPDLGILGSALNGWDTDIDMETSDGIVYTLKDLVISDGYVKFRHDDKWAVNWGGYEFPIGYAWMGGPDIPVMAGTYDVTINLWSGQYSFKATTCPVLGINCPYDMYMMSEPGLCGAYVWFPDVTPAPNCGGEGLTVVQTAGRPPGSFFPVGTTTISYMLTNASGESVSCSFNVYVFNFDPPVMSELKAEFDPFWPPNHKMIPVTLHYSVIDNCGEPHCEVFAYSSELENWKGDGNNLVDTAVIDDHHILLRAERSGPGSGREYYIYVVCRDESWNYDYRFVTIYIPHDNRNQNKAGLKSASLDSPGIESPYGIQLWPNPASDHFNLKIDAGPMDVSSVYISDYTGRILSERKVTGPQTLRLGDELAPGFYLLNVRQGDKSETMKVIKN